MPFTSFNILAAEISPFLLVNLMLLLICFLIFYFLYFLLKVFEFYILHQFRKKENAAHSFSTLKILAIKILREIDIGAPLLLYLLFMVPVLVFSCLNLKYASSTSHTLFTASTFFSIFFFLVSLAVIGLMAYYVFRLFSTNKRYVSTDLELYCLGGYLQNRTLHHFPRNKTKVQRTLKNTHYFPAFGPYNLHFLNFINERSNEQVNLEELYKHITDEKEQKTYKK